jgi:hypothetical protein
MSNAGNADELGSVIHDVYDAPVAYPDAPGVFVSLKLLRSHWSGVIGKGQNLLVYSRKQSIIERIQFLPGGVHDFQRILNHGDGHVSYG